MHLLAECLKLIKLRAGSAVAAVAPRPDEKLKSYLRPGLLFWAAILIGVLIRIYFVVFTQGTYDVNIWQHHAEGIQQNGLIGYYHKNPEMNHPPFISTIISWLLGLSQATDVPFRILLRAPFALLDALTALLLLRLCSSSRYRFVIAASYWLNPLALIFSAYHGNTDTSIAFFLLLCTYLLLKDKPALAGAALGVSLWVKLPGILALPAFFFFPKTWGNRVRFLFAAAGAGILTYLPVLFQDSKVLFDNVFGYQGQAIITTAGIPVWGMRIFLTHFGGLPAYWQEKLSAPVSFYLRHNTLFCLVPIALLCWLRRSENTIKGLASTIVGIYAVLYGWSNCWAFQYLAWSVPFWFIMNSYFTLIATLLAAGYIYFLYWFICGNPWLLGGWNFAGHAYWPQFILLARDLALLFFFVTAWLFLINAVYRELAGCFGVVLTFKYRKKKAKTRSPKPFCRPGSRS
jgi:hypothetical protein